MPITLGCPSCGKRFRARDESAGKRVKCPYCAAAVPVPSSGDAEAPGDGLTTDLPTSAPPAAPVPTRSSPLLDDSGSVPTPASRPLPQPPSRPSFPKTAPPPAPAPVATPDDWGASPPPAESKPFPFESAPPSPPANPLGFGPTVAPGRAARTTPAEKTPTKSSSSAGKPTKTPDQLAAPGWRRTRGGLCWVLIAVFFLFIPGFVGFGKLVYIRAVGPLPTGEGLTIPGYVNSPEAGAVHMSKVEQLDVLLYGLPVILAGLCLTTGRLACGAAPRSSGAKGLFFCSGVFTLVGFAGLVIAGAADKLLMKETYYYGAVGFLVVASVAEFWFLVGLAASGVALKRPKVARAVGMVGFMGGLVAAVATVGWLVYRQEVRPKPMTDDWRMYEQAGVMLGWLLLLGVYWRAVSAVRGAIDEFLETVVE